MKKPPITMRWLGHAFYATVRSGSPPPWIRLGEGVNVLVDLRDWPGNIGLCFKPDDGLPVEEFEALTEALMDRWAPIEEWVIDPGQNTKPNWIIRRLEVSCMRPRPRRNLMQGHWIVTNPWLNGTYARET